MRMAADPAAVRAHAEAAAALLFDGLTGAPPV
jgi:hypothetical protein